MIEEDSWNPPHLVKKFLIFIPPFMRKVVKCPFHYTLCRDRDLSSLKFFDGVSTKTQQQFNFLILLLARVVAVFIPIHSPP